MEEKNCKDCVHFLEYYTKRNTNFRKTGKGHCVKTSGGRFRLRANCANILKNVIWQKKNCLKSAKQHIDKICERINELSEAIEN